jgi:hypothetical protein
MLMVSHKYTNRPSVDRIFSVVSPGAHLIATNAPHKIYTLSNGYLKPWPYRQPHSDQDDPQDHTRMGVCTICIPTFLNDVLQ